MFFLDASGLIFAKNFYYQFDRVPQFWDWLVHHADTGIVKIPKEIHEELLRQDDELKAWAQEHKDVLVYAGDDYDDRLADVLAQYEDGGPLSEEGLEKVGQDPYLIACALSFPGSQVITGEESKPKRRGANRHIPDVCNSLEIEWTNVHGLVGRPGLVNILDFRIDWADRL